MISSKKRPHTNPSQLNLSTPTSDPLSDPLFAAGQLPSAFDLGDAPKPDSVSQSFVPDWDDAFLQSAQEIHGVLLVTGPAFKDVSAKLEEVKSIFRVVGEDETVVDGMGEVVTLAGDVRPGRERGHEQ